MIYTHPTAVNPAVTPYYPEPSMREPENYVTPSTPAEHPLATARRLAAEQPSTFTDSSGETFSTKEIIWLGEPTIVISSTDGEGLGFFKADATKIIALIAEAAK